MHYLCIMYRSWPREDRLMSMVHVREDRIEAPDRHVMHTALRARNPEAQSSELVKLEELLSSLFEIVIELPKARREEIERHPARISAAFGEALSRTVIEEEGDIEVTSGTGLGEILGAEEGHARLARYANPIRLEDWAGEVAGAVRIERVMGIKRSTLASWYQQGAIVGLLRGRRKLAYPLEQFVDARPLEGLEDLIRLAPDARSAWLWARQPHGALDGRTPLEILRAGGRHRALEVAEQDFG